MFILLINCYHHFCIGHIEGNKFNILQHYYKMVLMQALEIVKGRQH